MLKKPKIFLGFSIIILVLTLLIFAFLSEKKEPASAQEFSTPTLVLVCDEPIPTGEAVEEALELMTDTYSELQNIRYYLTTAIDQLQSEVSELYQNPEEICDFSACQPKVIDQAPDLKLKVSKPWGGTKTLLGAHIPLCKPKDCIGEPCPDLEYYLKDLTAFRDGISGSYEIIYDIFNTPSITVGEDIRIKEGPYEEISGTLIRWPTAVRRKLQLSREWLHSAAEEGKRSCSLSELEREKVAAGEMGDRYPMRCTDALEQGLYWPRVWSENCREFCKEGPTDQCKTCLGQNPGAGASVLAQINYKIYGVCGIYCQEELTLECLDCLCAGLSEKECTAWICGGNYYNYVCCHETPLEIE